MNKTKILLGRKIRELRKERKWTQEYLSELLDINPKSVLRIESGQTFPTIQNIEKLSEVFEQDYSATDINNVGDMEYQLSLLAYSDYSKSTKLEYNSYTVNNFYWGDIKEAMLDLGLKNNDRIYVPKYYNNSLNYFFNNYLNGSPIVVIERYDTA